METTTYIEGCQGVLWIGVPDPWYNQGSLH